MTNYERIITLPVVELADIIICPNEMVRTDTITCNQKKGCSASKLTRPDSNVRICFICGKEILQTEGKPVYIKTKRGTEFYVHKKCAYGR